MAWKLAHKVKFEEFRRFLEELKPIGAGWRGLVFRSRWQGMDVAIKVAKDKERVYAIKKEGRILELLKGIEGFPQLLYTGEDFIVYRFIEGLPIEELSLSIREKTLIYLKVLELIEILDRLKINKEELRRLDKNTLVDKEFRVYLLDFERGSLEAKKKHNLSQFLQLLVREGILELEKAKELGRRYKEGEEVYHEVRRALQSSF